jgi:hypothetical protein
MQTFSSFSERMRRRRRIGTTVKTFISSNYDPTKPIFKQVIGHNSFNIFLNLTECCSRPNLEPHGVRKFIIIPLKLLCVINILKELIDSIYINGLNILKNDKSTISLFLLQSSTSNSFQ